MNHMCVLGYLFIISPPIVAAKMMRQYGNWWLFPRVRIAVVLPLKSRFEKSFYGSFEAAKRIRWLFFRLVITYRYHLLPEDVSRTFRAHWRPTRTFYFYNKYFNINCSSNLVIKYKLKRTYTNVSHVGRIGKKDN